MKNFILFLLGLSIYQNINSQVLLQENFQTTGAVPTALPAGWLTNTVYQTQGTATTADDNQGPAFKVHNSGSANSGGYWPVPELGVNNRFAGANDDNVPCDCDNIDAWIQSPTINIPLAGNYTLGFDFFHDMNFGGGDATVQISTNGGASWQFLDTLTVDGSYWQSIVLPLYAFSGETVKIRFQWTDAGSWASGFAVDNVIVQSALDFDMIMAKTIASDWNNATFGLGFWEYSQVPVTQASPIKATSVLYNGGFNDQQGVYVNYEVNFNGTLQSSFNSNLVDVISLNTDTVSGVSTWTPFAVGTVSIASTVFSPNGDDNMENNMGSAQIQITTDIYARDNGSAQSFVGPGNAYEYGNLFDIYANDQIGAIDVAVNFSTGDEGSLIQGKLYEFTGLDATTGEPMLTDLGVSTIEYAVTAADNNAAGDANFIHLTFNEPISLEAGKVYMATIISDGAIRTPVSGTNDWSVSWLNDGTWGATGGIPMIRLNFNEFLSQSLGCTDPTACNFDPNANADDNSCYYPSGEVCDNMDNDCDGLVDEELPNQTWYADFDGDGVGNVFDTYWGCSAIPGYINLSGDCDDFNPLILGGTPEVCDDFDNDCDGQVDEEISIYYYFDADNDGYGTASSSIFSCNPPVQYVVNSDDCNDGNTLINPGFPEICDGIDNNCNLIADDGLALNTFYVDEDADGYGGENGGITNCLTAIPGYATNSEDCNDTLASINPLATEIDDNDIDENCDGLLGVSTSVQDYQEQNGVQIYPNPAQSFIRINGLSESSTVRIFDATGKEVKFVRNYAVSQMIELHDLSSGFYIVQIQTGVEIKHATIELLR